MGKGSLAIYEQNNNAWWEKESKDYLRTKYPFSSSTCTKSGPASQLTTDGALQQNKQQFFFPVAGWTVCVRRSLMSHPSIIHHHIYGPVSQLIQINGAYRKHERKLQGQKINQLTARSISRGKWVIFSLLMVHCALLSYIGYTHYKYTIKIWGIDSLEPQLGSLNMMCFSPFAVNRSKFSKLLRVFNRQTFEIQLNKLKRWG